MVRALDRDDARPLVGRVDRRVRAGIALVAMGDLALIDPALQQVEERAGGECAAALVHTGAGPPALGDDAPGLKVFA